jgi:hypothetical protein
MSRRIGKLLSATVAVSGTIAKGLTKTLTATVTTLADLVPLWISHTVQAVAAKLGLTDVQNTKATITSLIYCHQRHRCQGHVRPDHRRP